MPYVALGFLNLHRILHECLMIYFKKMEYKKEFWKLFLSRLSIDSTFTLGVFIIFMISQGLSLSQVSLAMFVYYLTIALGAIPAGIFADTYGYKKALVVGSFAFLFGTLVIAFGTSFFSFLLGWIFMGLGYALKQGQTQAQLYKLLELHGKTNQFKEWAGKLESYMNLFLVLATISGGFMYSAMHRLPFYFEAVLAFISLLAVILIKEIKTEDSKRLAIFQIKDSLHFATNTPNFSKIFIFSAIIGSIALMTMGYTQPLFNSFNIPPEYFGIIAAGLYIMRGFGSWYSDKLGKIFSIDHYLVLHSAIFGLFLVLLQRVNIVWFIFPILAILYFMRGIYTPTMSTFINIKAPDEKRATMLSMNDLLLTLFSAIGFFFVGLVADNFGLQNVFFTLSILSLSYLIFYVLLLRKVRVD